LIAIGLRQIQLVPRELLLERPAYWRRQPDGGIQRPPPRLQRLEAKRNWETISLKLLNLKAGLGQALDPSRAVKVRKRHFGVARVAHEVTKKGVGRTTAIRQQFEDA
jgi:hypothetical protein